MPSPQLFNKVFLNFICRIQVGRTDYTMASAENKGETSYEAWIKKCPDFTLVAGSGEELKCHKNFLCMHSPVFETMINSEFKEAKMDRADIKTFDTMASILPEVYLKSQLFVKFHCYMY